MGYYPRYEERGWLLTMPFERGKSGNPSGRPKKSKQQIDFEEKCRNWGQLYAFDKLKKLAESEDEKMVQIATKELLDRGFGRSVETSVVESYVTQETGATVSEIESSIAELIGSQENKSGGSDSADKLDPGK